MTSYEKHFGKEKLPAICCDQLGREKEYRIEYRYSPLVVGIRCIPPLKQNFQEEIFCFTKGFLRSLLFKTTA